MQNVGGNNVRLPGCEGSVGCWWKWDQSQRDTQSWSFVCVFLLSRLSDESSGNIYRKLTCPHGRSFTSKQTEKYKWLELMQMELQRFHWPWRPIHTHTLLYMWLCIDQLQSIKMRGLVLNTCAGDFDSRHTVSVKRSKPSNTWWSVWRCW